MNPHLQKKKITKQNKKQNQKRKKVQRSKNGKKNEKKKHILSVKLPILHGFGSYSLFESIHVVTRHG